jgi:hypothetical protein
MHAMHGTSLRRYLMSPEELSAYDALRWRGCYSKNRRGLSWSPDREVAAKFPTLHRYRRDGSPLVIQAETRRAGILALKLDRADVEVIAWLPKVVGVTKPDRAEAPSSDLQWCIKCRKVLGNHKGWLGPQCFCHAPPPRPGKGTNWG